MLCVNINCPYVDFDKRKTCFDFIEHAKEAGELVKFGIEPSEIIYVKNIKFPNAEVVDLYEEIDTATKTSEPLYEEQKRLKDFQVPAPSNYLHLNLFFSINSAC